MILFNRILFTKKVLNNVLHHSILIDRFMVACGWALVEGDWWKDADEDEAKFFSACWNKPNGVYRITGIFIGRLAMVFQYKEKQS